MKRILLIIIFTVTALGVYATWGLPSHDQTVILTVPTPTILPKSHKTIMVGNETMGYDTIVAQPSQVSLISNFSEKKTSSELIVDNSCKAGINGGFYDTAYRPLGLFITDFQAVGRAINSTLFNGYIGIGANNDAFIGDELLDVGNRIALQTGPLLITNGQPRTLAIKNDEHARRMIAAITSSGELALISLYQPESVFDGPLLTDVPQFVAALAKQEALNITNAINLDGGSASAFYGDSLTLSELTSVGSFFCIKSL